MIPPWRWGRGSLQKVGALSWEGRKDVGRAQLKGQGALERLVPGGGDLLGEPHCSVWAEARG